jgi:hypothetical protein
MNRIHYAVDIVEAPSISSDKVYTCDSSYDLIMYSIMRPKVIPGNAPGIVTAE